MLLQEIKEDLSKWYQDLTGKGDLLSRSQLSSFYSRFRERFGPERLKRLDGEDLLDTMLNMSDTESMVYWLEFKNDDEFPADFGSISGGSALKYGIYKRKESGTWMTGSPRDQKELSLEAAIEVARDNRDQFIRGCEVLEAFSDDADDAAYLDLQKELNRVAPGVNPSAWGHKYFSLLYPEKIDDYHNEYYQRYHLIKILQLPPCESGRYICAGRFQAAARELEIPMNSLTTILNARDGSPHSYWTAQIGNNDAGWNNDWQELLNGGFFAQGWPNTGDLSDFPHNKEGKSRLSDLMESIYGGKKDWFYDLHNFGFRMQVRDIIVAVDGNRVLGIGRIADDYRYNESATPLCHRRPVEWLSEESWTNPGIGDSGRGISPVKSPEFKVEIEKHILSSVRPITHTGIARVRSSSIPGGIPGKIQSVLERKGQVILHGPPGTGKTFWAKKTALDLASSHRFGKFYDALTSSEKEEISGSPSHDGLLRICTFHPAYGYEDFIEGYRPVENHEGQASFSLKPGIFRKLCSQASENRNRRYYLLVDEINRGDIPRIFGELITLLEKDKRDERITLPLSGELFSVPPNVFLIGTMNTADRSIALLDTALRRRFGFIELLPDPDVLGTASVGGIPLSVWLKSLNSRILRYIGRDARSLQIGHAYLLEKGIPVSEYSHFVKILEDDIIPLLQEYCYEDYSALEKILGKDFIDLKQQRIRSELFDPARKDDCIRALIAADTEMSGSAEAAAVEEEPENLDEEENTEG